MNHEPMRKCIGFFIVSFSANNHQLSWWNENALAYSVERSKLKLIKASTINFIKSNCLSSCGQVMQQKKLSVPLERRLAECS